jgi:hypothetical protein
MRCFRCQHYDRGQAVFFSYYDKATGLIDDGRTLHSGCPIKEGTKVLTVLEYYCKHVYGCMFRVPAIASHACSRTVTIAAAAVIDRCQLRL